MKMKDLRFKDQSIGMKIISYRFRMNQREEEEKIY